MNKILVVDDNETNLKILKLLLTKEGYSVVVEKDSKVVRTTIFEEKPDLILLDINMPDINGIELCKRINNDKELSDIPIIFVSALSASSDIANGFSAGAVDYITKPYKAEEVLARVRTHLKIKDLQNTLKEQNENLKEIVKQQVKKISEMQMQTIFSLAKLAQSRDDDTGSHLERVQKYCYAISTELARDSVYKDSIDERFIKNLFYASALHDIGKVAIPDAILLKPGKLTSDEFDTMKLHTSYGADTLELVRQKFGKNEFIDMGIEVTKYHHERWDGRGYLEGLRGEEIPLSARIMAIADVYDALRSERKYKEAFSYEKSIEIIKEGRGTQFDPYIVDAFLNICAKFK